MKKDDWEFMERIRRDQEARKAACKILEVEECADKVALRKAYRRASLKYHPDHNGQIPDANKKFILVKCAYELLVEDRPCPELLEEINSWLLVPDDEKYKLDNPWGHFLWWREKYFSSDKETEQDEAVYHI